MSQVPSKIVSRLLEDWRAGDDQALRAVVPLVYDELRRVAHHFLQKERADHTLQSTALVHEAYLRLEKQGAAELRFFGGLSIEETADALKLSPMTAKRHWASAPAWLHHQISQT